MKLPRTRMILAAVFGIGVCTCGAATGTLRIVSYNIDCADQGSDNNITGSTHSLPTVIQGIGLHHIGANAQPVDVLGVEELTSTTLANFVAQLNAIYGAGTYASDPTADPNTGGGPDGLIYNTHTVQVVSARALKTGQTVLLQSDGTYTTAHSPGGGVNGVTRAPMVYQLRPVGYGATNDFYMYVSHARSTSDDSVGDARYAEAQEVRSDAKYNLPAGAHVLYSGDWNLFSGSGENAYNCLTGQTTSDATDWSDTSAIWANTNQTQAYDPTSKTTPPTTTTWANVSGDSATYLYGDSTASLTSRIDIQLPNAPMFGVYNSKGGVQLAPDKSDPFDTSSFPSAKYPYAFEVFGNNGTTPRSSTPTNSANHSLDDLAGTVPNAATVYADLKLTGSGSTFTGSDHYPIVGDYIVVVSTSTPPAITVGPASRTNNAGTTATFTVSATGTAPLIYQWRKNTTNLANAGNVSGVATTNLTLMNVTFGDAGDYTVVISNSAGAITSSVAVLTVRCPVITVGPASLANGTAGTAYNQTNTASGGVGATTFAVTSGSLPAGLNLNTNSGVISGTPTTVGANTFIVTATDANGCTGGSGYTVNIGCPAITVGPENLADGTANLSYLQTNTASGSVGITTFAVTSGSLPTGLNLNTNNGIISGTPTTVGANTFIVTATDANGCTGSSSYTVNIGCPAITVGPENLADGTANASYLQTNTASGGVGATTFAVTSGALPTGLNLNTNNGIISGTPTTVGTNTFTVTATDAKGCTGSSNYTVTIGCPAITIGPENLADGTANLSYLQTNTASGGVGATTFAVTSGSLPTGLDLNTNSGVISGTPTIVGTNTFTVTAIDANGCTGSSNYTVTIGCPSITVGPASLADGTANASYLQTNTASGGVGATTFAVTSGALPTGLDLNTNAGVISGTPTSVGTNTFTVTATDAKGCTGNSSYTVAIGCPAITIGPENLPDGTANLSYLQTNTASGGVGATTFAVTSGALPTGLDLNTNTGVISGAPTSVGTNTFTVTATDANGCTGSSNYTVTIASPANSIGPVTLSLAGFATNGDFQFTISSSTNTDFGIQASTNLADWTLIGSGTTDTNGMLFFQDTNTVAFPIRYYRAVSASPWLFDRKTTVNQFPFSAVAE